MSEQISLLDFQTDKPIFDTEWKWNNVSEEMEKKNQTFYTVSKERLTKAGPMIWLALKAGNKTLNETLYQDNENKDITTTH